MLSQSIVLRTDGGRGILGQTSTNRLPEKGSTSITYSVRGVTKGSPTGYKDLSNISAYMYTFYQYIFPSTHQGGS
ncbi:hypothetical protein SK128_012856 [Halocaridina rubra]|uniref:Uncharacterized protein n=1 Tax=Halocaridina rubra TaxID=373956 RepID=A0AAN8WV93_HALRR